VLWSFLGGPVLLPLIRRRGEDEPREARDGEVHKITRPDGTRIHVEVYGPPDAPPMVLTHGWAQNSTEWYYAKRQLAGRFRLMNWMSYLNGSAHRSNESSGFSGRETRGQLEFTTRQSAKASPAVLARGMFGMLRYDATAVLGTIRVPALVFVGDQDGTTIPEA